MAKRRPSMALFSLRQARSPVLTLASGHPGRRSERRTCRAVYPPGRRPTSEDHRDRSRRSYRPRSELSSAQGVVGEIVLPARELLVADCEVSPGIDDRGGGRSVELIQQDEERDQVM